MLELKTKWFTNSLAKQSIANKDFILCHDGNRLFIVGYGEITRGGKNTYNIALKDTNDVLIREENNLYLDAITKIILGTSPKAKANKEGSEKKSAKSKKRREAKSKKRRGSNIKEDSYFAKMGKRNEAIGLITSFE